MNDLPVLNVSKSAVDAYRECQQLYYYRYFQKLRSRAKARPLELGSMLHKYLETYYTLIQAKVAPQEAHENAKVVASAEFTPTVKASAEWLLKVGQADKAKEMLSLLPSAGRIADRYFMTRGISDAEEYTVLMVETWLNLDLLEARDDLPMTRSNSKLDMLTEDKATGRVHLWEHKSGAEIPDMQVRLRDLQSTLYAQKLYQLKMIPKRIDAVMWNYLRTKEPTTPEQLKSGQLTKRQDLDTTWEVYIAELNRLKLPIVDYQEQRERLEGREETVYFPRYEQVILADARRLLGDYVQTAKDIRAVRAKWEQQTQRPVRTLGRHCDWCEFARLCNAALMTGSDRDARSEFVVEERSSGKQELPKIMTTVKQRRGRR